MPLTSLFDRLSRKRQHQPGEITIVSGLPRSGTSLMMKMLQAGGMPPMTDNLRTADTDNPGGYYEFEPVKKLSKGETAWLADAEGKAVKVIAALLPHLPPDYRYRVIFMRRDMGEVLASQRQMLVRRGVQADPHDDEQMARLFERHLQTVDDWIESQPNVARIDVSHRALLNDPRTEIERINAFLDGRLAAERMAEVIDPRLYRQRKAEAGA
jgi:hypothetical protein